MEQPNLLHENAKDVLGALAEDIQELHVATLLEYLVEEQQFRDRVLEYSAEGCYECEGGSHKLRVDTLTRRPWHGDGFGPRSGGLKGNAMNFEDPTKFGAPVGCKKLFPKFFVQNAEEKLADVAFELLFHGVVRTRRSRTLSRS